MLSYAAKTVIAGRNIQIPGHSGPMKTIALSNIPFWGLDQLSGVHGVN